jgi:hypothetical protein
MNDVKWDSKTYQETIIECIETLGLDWTTFTAALDKTKCYSFGFSHPSRHKFCITPKVWFIQSVVTDEKSAQYLWASDQTPIELIPTQELYNMPVGTLRELYKKSSSALEDFLNTGEVCFGFIMRSVNPSLTKNSSDLFIESSLMRAIRRFWYENTLIDLCHKNNWNMEKAITLQAYLDTTNQQTFLKLFPQYTETFNKYSVEVMKLVNEMITSTLTKNTSESTTVNTLLQLFRDTVSYNTTNVNKEILATVYSDFVRHPDSLEILMSAWN